MIGFNESTDTTNPYSLISSFTLTNSVIYNVTYLTDDTYYANYKGYIFRFGL